MTPIATTIVDNDSLYRAARLAGRRCRYVNALTNPPHLVMDDGGTVNYGDVLICHTDGPLTVAQSGQETLW